MVYVVATSRAATVWTNAAFGENVPAKPPDSFQPTMRPAVPKPPPLILMPTSWLMPRVCVHRSAFPLSSTVPLTDGVICRVSDPLPRSCHVAPSLPATTSCVEMWADARGAAVLRGG